MQLASFFQSLIHLVGAAGKAEDKVDSTFAVTRIMLTAWKMILISTNPQSFYPQEPRRFFTTGQLTSTAISTLRHGGLHEIELGKPRPGRRWTIRLDWRWSERFQVVPKKVGSTRLVSFTIFSQSSM